MLENSNVKLKDGQIEKAAFGQTLNNVHHVILNTNHETVQPLTHHPHSESYTEAVQKPPKVEYAGMWIRPKGEVLYRGEAYVNINVDPITRSFEITQSEQEVTHGDLYALKGLQADNAFGFALSEAVKRVFKGKQIYEIRLNFLFKMCYNLEINKNRMFLGVTLVDEDAVNDELSMDEKMLIELACNLTYGYFAQLNKLENPLTEQEIMEIQKEYEALNQNFVENESKEAKSGEWDVVREYEVIERDVETGKIIKPVQSENLLGNHNKVS